MCIRDSFSVFLRHLKNTFYASLSTILVIVSSFCVAKQLSIFHPGSLCLTYLALYVFLISKNVDGSTWATRLVLMLLIGATTIEYAFSPIFLTFFGLSRYILSILYKNKRKQLLEIAIIPAMFFIFWVVYITTFFSKQLGSILLNIAESLEFKYISVISYLRGNIGANYPWWGNLTRLWWLLFFGFGSLLMTWKLISFKKHDFFEKIELTGFVATALYVSAGFIVSPGGFHAGLARYFWTSPLFLVPSIIRAISSSKMKNYGFSLLFASLLIFTFPTFLINMDTIGASYIYPQEYSMGSFISFTCREGKLSLYSFGLLHPIIYFVPNAQTYGQPTDLGIIKEQENWKILEEILENFQRYNKDEFKIFILSEKMKEPYEEFLGISRDDSRWSEMESQLLKYNRVYDSQFNNIFQRSP